MGIFGGGLGFLVVLAVVLAGGMQLYCGEITLSGCQGTGKAETAIESTAIGGTPLTEAKCPKVKKVKSDVTVHCTATAGTRGRVKVDATYRDCNLKSICKRIEVAPAE